ncbi:MAG: paraquat-inducible protein A [Verrucomicrobiota bacterium]
MKGNFLRVRKALLPWPKPRGGPHRSVCHFCDTLHEALPLPEGTAARCRCCGAVLYQNRPASLVRATAFSFTSLVLMGLMHWFPFLVMDAASVRTTLNLSSASQSLYQQGNPILALMLALFTIVTPICLAGGLIYVCGPLLFGRVAPGGVSVAKWLSRMEPWNMIEVFLLGVLVSLLKLGKVADVHFGIGFWAFGLLMICMAAAVAGIDRDELWDRLEVARS